MSDVTASTAVALPAQQSRWTRARLITTASIVAYAGALVVFCATVGAPTKRVPVLLWVALAVIAVEAGDPRRAVRSLAFAWTPVFLALGAYDLLRGSSDDLAGGAHANPQLAFDERLFGGITPTVRLQHWLYTPGTPHWWDYVAWATYTSHFIVPLALAVVLWKLRSPRFVPYLAGLLTLSYLALATYALFPAQPPWMLARDGELAGHVVRVVHSMWSDVGVHRAARLFDPSHQHESRYANPVAALPSLHAAFPVLILLALRGIDRRLTAALCCYALTMAFALVYGGEHFLFDVLMGWVYAVVAWRIAAAVTTAFLQRAANPDEPARAPGRAPAARW